MTPNAQTVGVFGVWAAGGGDNTFGGASVNPSTAALAVVKNSNTWNSGIVMMKDALTAGEALAVSSEGVGGAHSLNWYNSLGNQVFNVLSNATDTNTWKLNRINGGLQISVGGGQVAAFNSNNAPANGFTFTASATTVAPSIAAAGSDTNIDLALVPKGTGAVVPTSNGAAALGSTTKAWSNLFIATSGVLNFGAGNYTITHSAGVLTFSGALSTAGSVSSSQGIVAAGATQGIGYTTGAGGAVTQATSRTTGVTLNKVSGAITMFSAAGSATAATFTVTNSAVAATDTIILNQKSGTNLYNFIVTAVAAGSFNITFYTTGGTATDAPVISFNVIKGVTA
jgi:hypothetical protein